MKRTLSLFFCICCLGLSCAVLQSCANGSSSSTASANSSTSSVSAKSDSSDQQFSQVDDSKEESKSQETSIGNSSLKKQLLNDVKPIVKKADMDMGVCVIDLKSGTQMDIDGNERMVAASMIKLAIAASFLQYVEDDNISLHDTYVVKESDIVGGTGSLGGRGAGAETTYGELLELMIAESDNTAANILIDEMGMKMVNRRARELGLTSTELNRYMMDEEAIEKGTENYVSANDVARILELAYNGELVSAKASKTLLSALEKQKDKNGISEGLPNKVVFAHKTGSLANAQHDGGIAEGPNDCDCVLVVLCGGKGYTQDGAFDAMKSIGKIAYKDIADAQSS